jgi:hypothetical protein
VELIILGISFESAIIPAAVAGAVLIILFIMDAVKKGKKKKK